MAGLHPANTVTIATSTGYRRNQDSCGIVTSDHLVEAVMAVEDRRFFDTTA